MRILLDGANPSSRSGPNSFSKKLKDALHELGHIAGHAVDEITDPNARILFIQGSKCGIPTALRLDGIYFNTRQAWREMNLPIQESYSQSEIVIHQTEFDRRLIEMFFGAHPFASVISNGADPRKTMAVSPLVHPVFNGSSETWVCASSWRPHKRLADNIRFFREHAGPSDVLVVAGDIAQVQQEITGISLDRVFFAGDLDQQTLISLYRRSSHLVHLAWLDHCPNVVVDARAAGCKIVCASSGGTEEVAGRDAIVIEEDEWDMSPLDLYSPPPLDFSRRRDGRFDHNNDILDVAEKYVRALERIVK